MAAERARVSRSWVTLHRASDPAFRARIAAAVAEARERLRARADGMAPPGGWGSLDGEELAVRGTNGRRTQIARARLNQFTPRSEDRFLGALAATCNVKAACAEVGLSPAAAYNHRKRWPAFAERWDAAIAAGSARIEFGLVEAACNLFSRTDKPASDTVRAMTADQAIHVLHMHQHRVHGIGKRPGLMPRPRTLDELRERIWRKVEAIRRGERIPDAEMARVRADWAARRRGG